MKKLILIRHGETEYTRQRRYCGHGDIPLNIKGIEQAKRLRAKLKNIKIDIIYSSDLKRALQTAKIAFPKRIIYKRKGLRENDFGQFSGLTFGEASKIYPRVYRRWMCNPLEAKIPDGENLPNFAKRVEGCFKRIFDRNPKRTVVLVSHGGAIRIMLLKLRHQGWDKFWDITVKTADVNIIRF
ncbi:MAG: histidine phosphatase family protein [Omnitrophica bacterium]|nr:histidine phosphatase family protein [Candidatus Omnitrophota bacterium]